jgi:Uncharacterized protein conserved in bacteria
VTTAVVGPFTLLVNPALPVNSTAELVKYAKANPGKLNYGTPGAGSSIHVTTKYFKVLAGIDMVTCPTQVPDRLSSRQWPTTYRCYSIRWPRARNTRRGKLRALAFEQPTHRALA